MVALVLSVGWNDGSEGGLGSVAVTIRMILNVPSSVGVNVGFTPVIDCKVV